MMVLQSCNLAKNEVTTTSNFEESARSILSAEDSKLARFDKTSYEYEHVRPNLLWIPEVEKKYLLALWLELDASLHLIRTFADHGYRHHRRQPIRLPFPLKLYL